MTRSRPSSYPTLSLQVGRETLVAYLEVEVSNLILHMTHYALPKSDGPVLVILRRQRPTDLIILEVVKRLTCGVRAGMDSPSSMMDIVWR